MKIGIMTVNDHTFHPNARLAAEAGELGHEVVLIDPYGVSCCLDRHGPDALLWSGQKALPDLILPRQGSPMGEYGFVLLRHFALLGIPLVNGIEGIAISKHQYITLQQLLRAGLSVPRAFFVTQADNFHAAVDALGGFPVVAKPVDGMGGDGVAKLGDKSGADAWLADYLIPAKGVVIEPFILHDASLRLLVTGHAVAAAMSLTPAPGQFRGNIHQKGVCAPFEPDKKLADMAVRAARACCLDIAGVDILLTKDQGPVVIEVNYSPGFRGLEAATGENIAKRILECAISCAGNQAMKKEVP